MARDMVVVGGGIAGLAAATYAARAGVAVTLVERSGSIGGRARTRLRDGFRMNLGPHALYRTGEAQAVLDDLGIALTGGVPAPSGYRVLRGGRVRSMACLGGALGDPLAALRLLVGGAASAHTTSLGAWLDDHVRGTTAGEAILAAVRLATHCHDPDLLSVAAAAQALRAGARGVRYLDGGWQSMVDALRHAAVAAGTTVHAGAPAELIEHDARVRGVRLADGEVLHADLVIAAPGGPAELAGLLHGGPAAATAAGWAAAATPVRAACLDVGLRTLPAPAVAVVVGIDDPVYLSVHSRYADLVDGPGALLHVMRYRRADEPADPARHRGELEDVLDRAQPGWRDHVATQRFLPDIAVASDLPAAARGGLVGRPGPGVPGVEGLWVAGDFVGGTGMLADAALGSARAAAQAALQASLAAPHAPAAAVLHHDRP